MSVETLSTDHLRADACDKYWETLATLIPMVAPAKKSSLIAKVRAAKLTSDKTELPAAWDEAMSEPCAAATYGKSFKRITGRDITLYDALAYRDKAALFDSAEGRRALGLEEYCDPGDVEFNDDNADGVWRELDNMAVYARTFATGEPFDITTVARPSRDEIADEIARRKAEKQKRKKQPAVHATLDEARVSMLATVFGALHPSQAVQIDGDFVTTLTAEISADPARKKGVEALEAEVVAAIPCVASLGLRPVSDETAEAWRAVASAVAKVDGVARMSSSIPASVMTQIESQAAALAGGLCNGSVDLEQMDFASIGQNVLQSCSQEDVEAMTGNIGELLPNLGQLARSLQADGGPMAGSVDAMLGAAMGNN